jgi:hypothetical protein
MLQGITGGTSGLDCLSVFSPVSSRFRVKSPGSGNEHFGHAEVSRPQFCWRRARGMAERRPANARLERE